MRSSLGAAVASSLAAAAAKWCRRPGAPIAWTGLVPHQLPAGFVDSRLPRKPVGRSGDPEELAAAPILASRSRGYVAGTTPILDGGDQHLRHAQLFEENCAIARSSGIIGERWIWVILRQAFNGARRFEDFQRGIGLARNVLTDRLHWLVDYGILERRPYSKHGERDLHEYRLTSKGRGLFPVYTALMKWGNDWTGLQAPPVDLFHKPCGQRVTVRVVCSHCSVDIDVRDTEPVVGRGVMPKNINSVAQTPAASRDARCPARISLKRSRSRKGR